MARVQSVLFARSMWTQDGAREWLAQHGYRVPAADTKANYLHYRQEPPAKDAMYFSRPEGTPGVLLVLMRIPGGGATRDSAPSMPSPDEPTRQDTLDVVSDERLPGSRVTSDNEVEAWGRANIPGFLGVVSRTDFGRLYPADSPMTPGSSCVLNLDPGYSHGGSHWVAVRVADSQPQIMYFDSFGLPPPREVTLRGRLDARGVLYPDVQYQGIEEVNCGPRALAALKYLSDAAAKGEELEAFGKLGDL